MAVQPEAKILLSRLASSEFCYVTTSGRVTGRPHRIEIWFGMQGSTVYLLSGNRDRSDWVKNMHQQPVIRVQIAEHTFSGQARMVEGAQEDALARRLLAAKYQQWQDGLEMSDWARTALAVAIDLAVD